MNDWWDITPYGWSDRFLRVRGFGRAKQAAATLAVAWHQTMKMTRVPS